MKIENRLLKNDEKTVFELRSLYEKFGYSKYKMSKFEEYDLYVKNKDFLVSDSIITFTDTNGKLMALKPDVTLSIIKSTEEQDGILQKLYYNENVYRVSKSTSSFKEIMQVGIECIGDIDCYSIFEVLSLACESLEIISDDFVLDVSHMGIVTELLDRINLDRDDEKELIKCMGEKNAHGVSDILARCSADDENAKKLGTLTTLYGNADEVCLKLKDIAPDDSPALCELCKVMELCKKCGYSDKIHIDFSVINDMGYYNGFVFKGFIKSVPDSVLSGGQYDKLMAKMHRKSKAIGFAVYPDFLERYGADEKEYDVDTVIVYDKECDGAMLFDKVKELTDSGKSVSVQKKVPEKLKYKELMRFGKRGLEVL